MNTYAVKRTRMCYNDIAFPKTLSTFLWGCEYMSRGLVRFGIVLMLIVLLLPYVLPLIGVADPDFEDVVTVFAKWFPMGSSLKKLGFMLCDKQFGFYETFDALRWFFDKTVSGWEAVMELSRLFYIGGLLSDAKRVFKKIFGIGGKGIWNRLADFLLLNIALIPVTMLSSEVFRLCKWLIEKYIPLSAQDELYMLMAVCCFLGTFISVCFREKPIVSLLECIWKSISAMYIFMVCCCIAFYDTPLSRLSITHICIFILCYFVAEGLFSAAKGK